MIFLLFFFNHFMIFLLFFQYFIACLPFMADVSSSCLCVFIFFCLHLFSSLTFDKKFNGICVIKYKSRYELFQFIISLLVCKQIQQTYMEFIKH